MRKANPGVDRDTAGRIDLAVEGLEGELVAFLQKIVRIPTENPPGENYPECTRAIGEALEEAGCEVRTVKPPAERLAELAPHGGGHRLFEEATAQAGGGGPQTRASLRSSSSRLPSNQPFSRSNCCFVSEAEPESTSTWLRQAYQR